MKIIKTRQARLPSKTIANDIVAPKFMRDNIQVRRDGTLTRSPAGLRIWEEIQPGQTQGEILTFAEKV